jgi:uncharacterized protein YjaG (DUF416 family)
MTIEQAQSQLDLLKQALMFYAKKDNYLFYKHKDSPIALDEGMQARFALEQLEKVDEVNKNMGEDYQKLIEDIETPEAASEKLIKEIRKITKWK